MSQDITSRLARLENALLDRVTFTVNYDNGTSHKYTGGHMACVAAIFGTEGTLPAADCRKAQPIAIHFERGKDIAYSIPVFREVFPKSIITANQNL